MLSCQRHRHSCSHSSGSHTSSEVSTSAEVLLYAQCSRASRWHVQTVEWHCSWHDWNNLLVDKQHHMECKRQSRLPRVLAYKVLYLNHNSNKREILILVSWIVYGFIAIMCALRPIDQTERANVVHASSLTKKPIGEQTVEELRQTRASFCCQKR
jgi:hypothetical protein